MESCDQQGEASIGKDDAEDKNAAATAVNENIDNAALTCKDKKGGFTLARHSLSSLSKRRPFSRYVDDFHLVS